jgi:uncharacterized protein (DUF433 family)
MDNQLLERIALNPKVMAGKSVIRSTRLAVEYITGRTNDRTRTT